VRLARHGTTYAAGRRAARSRRTTVRLHALRRVQAGNYTLVVSLGREVTVRVPLKLS
jgi:hypothetical protein